MARAFKTGITADGDIITGGDLKFSSTGIDAPTFTTYSAGVRTVLYDNITADSAGYTIGINAGTLWQTIPAADAGQSFKWYGGTTVLATLTGGGALSTTGDITAGNNLRSSYSAGDEGGQIFLNKATTNTTLTSGVNIDVYQNKLRFWEDGGTNRGFYIDMTTGGTGVGTNLVSGGSYTLPAATSTVLGGIELFDNTVQSVASNAVSTTASRTYGLQVNASGQGVINVPWTDTDTNTYPTTWAWTGGTSAGPTASITGTSSTITVAAVPVANGTSASGVVTTGTQTFGGAKTFSSSVTAAGGLIITGGNSPIVLGTNHGTSGQVLTSQGTANTPIWSNVVTSVTGTSPIASSGGTTPAISIDQTVLYQGNIWTNENDYYLDFSGSAAGQSALGSTTRSFTLDAGNTYEIELHLGVTTQYVGSTTFTVSFTWDTASTTGSPTTTLAVINQFSNTTTATTAGSVTQGRSVAGTAGQTLMAATNTTTTQRWSVVNSFGQVRVTGTGTVKIFPKITANSIADNAVIVLKNSYFKIVKIGSSSLSTIGTWNS